LDKGIVLLAQNNSKDNYVEQATALAASINQFNSIPVTLITDDEVSDYSKKYFDQILPIAWGDMAVESEWKVENRWKVFHQSPYKETIVMDTDMLVTKDIEYLWDYYSNYDMFFTTNPVTYRGERISSNYYRKMFKENNLPNIYSALYYFKKTEFTHNFFAYLELVIKNFDDFQEDLCPNLKQDSVSFDVAAAMTLKLMDIADDVTNEENNTSKFVHMKPHVQNWKKPREKWQSLVPVHFTKSLDLYIGNYRQTEIFHYTEKDFLVNARILDQLGIENV
jgi:hypothetical protein